MNLFVNGVHLTNHEIKPETTIGQMKILLHPHQGDSKIKVTFSDGTILTLIHEDKLRDTTSVLFLKEGYSSGKSTLVRIMEKLASTYCRKQYGDFSIDRIFEDSWRKSISKYNSSLIIISELSSQECKEVDIKYHNIQRESGYISLFNPWFGRSDITAIFDPGVFLIVGNIDMKFQNDIVKRKKMPIELVLPNIFKYDKDIDSTIVDDCVKEFITLYEK